MAEITLEIAAYERMQSDLEREHMGKWVVEQGDSRAVDRRCSLRAIGGHALEVAVRRFGLGPTLPGRRIPARRRYDVTVVGSAVTVRQPTGPC